MVQALPLTQQQSPPNFPSASRQLVPYELPVAPANGTPALPQTWRFGVAGENGAAAWPRLHSAALPAREWHTLADLPLVSLSLPGLVLQPQAETLALEYRFDLPYTDEINALAQLPQEPPDPQQVSPRPQDPPPQPPAPLTRETLAPYWQELSNLASLAAADGVVAFQEGDGALQHLVEPWPWPVSVDAALTQ
ncbi:hypothetical protein [Halomicronema hongdechloris]|nr:hypothetical protein [Halomicronema hongdechloris]